MSAPQTMVERAERCLLHLRQARAEQQDEALRSALRTVSQRAGDARQRLESVLAVLPDIRAASMPPSAPSATLLLESRKAKTDLRTAATAVLRDEGPRGAERLTTPTVHEALRTAERLSTQLLDDANRAVDRWRTDNLPAGVEREVVAFPGVSDLLVVKLKRVRDRLLAKVSGVPAANLPGRLDDLRRWMAEWESLTAEYEATREREDPEIKDFLDRAASPEGAPWASLTLVVRRWLDDADNADMVRIVLRS
jgi:hypothetical protein